MTTFQNLWVILESMKWLSIWTELLIVLHSGLEILDMICRSFENVPAAYVLKPI